MLYGDDRSDLEEIPKPGLPMLKVDNLQLQ